MGSPRCEGETSGRRLDGASDDREQYTRRRSLRTHRKSAFSRDYVLDIDREIMAIESMPEEDESKVVQLVGSAQQGSLRGGSELSDSLLHPQKRKRGRPRKHPPMAQVVSDVPKVKRPRGRPRGAWWRDCAVHGRIGINFNLIYVYRVWQAPTGGGGGWAVLCHVHE